MSLEPEAALGVAAASGVVFPSLFEVDFRGFADEDDEEDFFEDFFDEGFWASLWASSFGCGLLSGSFIGGFAEITGLLLSDFFDSGLFSIFVLLLLLSEGASST